MGITDKLKGRRVGEKGLLAIPISFETGEIAAVSIQFPFRALVTYLETIVFKAIAATDNATIVPSNSVGNMASGTVTIALSSAQGVVDTATPTGANRVIAAGTDLTLTPAKTTAGGKVMLTVHYVRS